VPARHEHADLDAARGGPSKGAAERAVWQKVRCRDAHVVRGLFDDRLKQHARDGRAIGRRVLDGERGGRARCLVRLVRFHAGEDFAAALEPVLGGDALNIRDDGTFDARHHVAPHRFSVVRPPPPVGHAGAADERDAAVDDEQFAVRAIVEAARLYQRIPRYASTRHPAAVSACRKRRNTPNDPIASITKLTRTPARARPLNASTNR
jgi:hypothetical protein